MKLQKVLLPLLAAAIIGSSAFAASTDAVRSFKQEPDGIRIELQSGVMKLQACADNIVHVQCSPTPYIPQKTSLVVLTKWKPVSWRYGETNNGVTLTTSRMMVRVDRQTGALSFLKTNGTPLLTEPAAGGRKFEAATVTGEATYHAQQVFNCPEDEAIYGIGQLQDGVFNWRGMPAVLNQYNSCTAMPFILSSKGYGLYWDNYSITYLNRPETRLEMTNNEGTFTPKETSEYAFEMECAGNNRVKLFVDDVPVIQKSNVWPLNTASGRVKLEGGKTYRLRVEVRGGNPAVSVHQMTPTTTLWSEVADTIDYYFISGDPDQVISSLRQATGAAPMLPKWAFGFWQCRERYSSQDEMLAAAAKYRDLKIPIDGIVQDWQYWGKYGWNAMKFDEQYYPDPAALLKGLHEKNIHMMISVWSNFDEGTTVAKDFNAAKLMMSGVNWVDHYNPAARKLYWTYLKKSFFDLGMDAWWMDATEPECGAHGRTLSIGSGSRYTNTYPLVATQGVYEGQKKSDPSKRVVILTRSAFVGQQRNSAISWSGDITGDFETLRKQIAAGLNFSMTGVPYWTTDGGGFFRPRDQYTNAAYQEVLIRWLQFSSFCPVFRVHGYQSDTALWNYGPETEARFRKIDELRYRLLPYTYSVAAQVTQSGYTMMRGLIMDFRNDPKVYNVADEYMFGPAILVNPVIKAGATSRNVYLPAKTTWVDFWTGESTKGGTSIDTPAPLDTIPLFVKTGSIIPFGPAMQYATEKPADPLDIRIYPGADGRFTLYEDENDGYNYEKGAYTKIQLSWNDAKKSFTVGKRAGKFNGMLKDRTFRLILVRPGQGNGLAADSIPAAVVHYTGAEVSTRL